jgi:basic membrane protein A and related proteins
LNTRNHKLQPLRITSACRTHERILPALILLAGLAACVKGAPVATKAPPAIFSTPTPAPSATRVPSLIIFAPEMPNTGVEQQARQTLTTFAIEHGWQVETISPADEIAPELLARQPGIIAGVGSGMGEVIQAAAEQSPAQRFLLVEEDAGEPLENLLVVGGPNIRKDEAGFMAGLLAGMVNTNHRAGWLGESGTIAGNLYGNGYLHGVHYLCPLCLLYSYDVPAGASAADGEAQADKLLGDYVSTASAMPGPAGDAALKKLAGRHVDVAGVYPGLYKDVFRAGSASGAEVVLGEPAIRVDIVLKDVLARWMKGEKFAEPIAYAIENGGLEFAPFSHEIITTGKQILLKEILDEIMTGRLSVGVNLKTGASE